MDKITRTKKAYINSAVTLVTSVLQIMLGFVIRKLFIVYLGVAYLGYNSVFSNILQMLNLADMGIGVAVTSFLYKPLADQDEKRIAAIIHIYKRLYTVIGVCVLIVGLIVSIFLNELIPDANCGVWYLRLLFYINLIGTVSTYFLAYKRTLVIADQKSYLTNIIDTVIYFIVSGLQLASLIVSPNYIVYLSLAIIKNIASNICVSAKVNRDYRYINGAIDQSIVQEYMPQIIQYVKDVFVSKIGAVVYYSTDNIILSVIKGSLLTGFLSNYTMLTGQLNAVVTQILSSVQATFGNYISTTNDKTMCMKMTDNYFCVNYCIGNFCMICFVLLAQPFVELVFGSNMLLAFSTVIWLGINLMLTFLIQLPSQIFIIYKLFKYDRPIIIISVLLNIVSSIVLVNMIGVNGVLIGTFLASLIYLFSRFFIISKYVYGVKFPYYLRKLFSYGLISILTFSIIYFVTKDVNEISIFGFAKRAVMVGALAVSLTSFLLSFTNEFEFLKNKLIPFSVGKYVNKITLAIICIIFMVASISLVDNSNTDFILTGNKSYAREDFYTLEPSTGNGVFSLSFDDTILLLEDIYINDYDSIFENSTLRWFEKLHESYGVVISCYVFFENGDFSLTEFPSKYQNQFAENSNWLRFGFHAKNDGAVSENRNLLQDYTKVITELERIMGKSSIDNVIRLHMFSASLDEITALSQHESQPIKGLFTADDNRQSYYLTEENNLYIYTHDMLYDQELDVCFLSTDIRTEYVDDMKFKLREFETESWHNQLTDLVVFSHEWALNEENKEKIEEVCKYAKNNHYRMAFFEDIL